MNMILSLISWFGLDTPDGRKRWASGVVTGLLTLFVNPILEAKGMKPVNPEILISLLVFVLGYIVQSMVKSKAAAQAATTVTVAKIQAEATVAAASATAVAQGVATQQEAPNTAVPTQGTQTP